MKKSQIRKTVLSQVFPDFIFQEGKNEFITFCPNGCHAIKRKLQINVEKNTGQCWSCGESGTALYFVKKYGTREHAKQYALTLEFKEDYQNKDLTLELPPDYKFLLDCKNTPQGRMAYQYIKEELKLSDMVILQNRIGVCFNGDYANRIIFCSYDEQGSLNYFVGRTLVQSTKKYLDCSIPKKRIVYNELYINWFKPLVLVEGIKAHLKHWEIGNIIPMNGSPVLTSEHKIYYDIVVNSVNKLYVAYDREAYEKSIETMNNIQACGVEVLFVDLTKQPDELETEEFKEAIRLAHPFSQFDYLKERVRML